MAVKLLTKLGDGVLVPSVLARATEPVVNRWPVTMFANLSGNLTGRDRNGTFSLVGTGALRWQPAPGARINYAINPSFEPSAGGWLSAGVSLQYVSDRATVGTTSLKGTVTATGPGSQQIIFRGANTYFPAQDYTLSVDCYNLGSDTVQAKMLAKAGGVSSAVVSPPFTVLPGVWQRLSWTFTLPIASESVTFHVIMSNNEDWQVGQVIYIDGACFANTGSTYFDGSSGVWLNLITQQLGSAHIVPSVERAVAWIEEGTTNEIPDPVFGNSTITNNWEAVGSATVTRDTRGDFAVRYTNVLDGGLAKIVTTSGSAGQGLSLLASKAPAVSAGQTRTAQVSLRRRSGTGDLKLQIVGLDASNAQTEVFETTFTPPANGAAMGDNLPYVTATFANANTVKYVVRVVTATASAQEFYVGYLGCEAKPYPTSPCIGNMGTGYSWAGTAHNSASTRAATTLTFSPAGRIAPVRGSVVLAARRVVNTGVNQTLLDVGSGGAGTDRLTLRFTAAGALQLACQSNGGAVTTVTTAETAALGTEVICYAAWDGTDISVRLGTGSLATGTRDAPAGSFGAGNTSLGTRQDGSDPLNGALGPLLVYTSPLSPMRRDVLVARGPARWRYDALVVEQRDGVRVITVAARSRGLVRPERAVRLGLERHGIDTEIALLTPAEARELAHLLLEVANAGEHGTTG